MSLRFPLPSNSNSIAHSLATSLTQRFRLVDIELVHDENPSCFRIGGYGFLDMSSEVLIGASLSYGGSDHLARGHLEVGEQTPGAVALVLVLLALNAARSHRKGGMEALQRLNATLLVGAYQVSASLVQLQRLCVMLTDSFDLLIKDLRLRFPLVV
jgi:hypothetical protein